MDTANLISCCRQTIQAIVYRTYLASDVSKISFVGQQKKHLLQAHGDQFWRLISQTLHTFRRGPRFRGDSSHLRWNENAVDWRLCSCNACNQSETLLNSDDFTLQTTRVQLCLQPSYRGVSVEHRPYCNTLYMAIFNLLGLFTRHGGLHWIHNPNRFKKTSKMEEKTKKPTCHYTGELEPLD